MATEKLPLKTRVRVLFLDTLKKGNSVEIKFYVFFLGANIAILDINCFGTVDGNDTKKMQSAEDAVGASGQIGCDKFYGVSS